MPEILDSGRSSTRKAAKLAVYDATMIIAKPAQTMPKTRAEKLLGVPKRDHGCLHEDLFLGKGRTFANAGVQQDSPGKPEGT